MRNVFVTFVMASVLMSCASNIKRVEKPIFRGEPTIEIVNDIKISGLSKLNIPSPNYNKFEFVVIDPKSGKIFTKPTYEINKNSGSIVRLSSYSESVNKKGLLGVRGTSVRETIEINSGGFINYASQTYETSKDNILTNRNHFHKYLLTGISEVKGTLFL